MDTKMLNIIVTKFSDSFILSIYKNRKINNHGFRASTEKDVKKNRLSLDSNLKKNTNLKILHNHLNIFYNTSLKDTFTSIQDISNEDEKLVFAYFHSDQDFIEDFIPSTIQNTEIVEKKPISKSHNSTQKKNEKIINRLEKKVENLSLELEKKDLIIHQKTKEITEKIKLQLNEKNSLLEQNLDLKRKIDSYKLENNLLKNENENFFTENKDLQNQINELSDLIEMLEKDIIATTLAYKNNVDNQNGNYRIAVLGNQSLKLLSKLDDHSFMIFNNSNLEDLFNTHNIYKEIWVIIFDLNQREKKLLNKRIEQLDIVDKINYIETLIDLNNLIFINKK